MCVVLNAWAYTQQLKRACAYMHKRACVLVSAWILYEYGLQIWACEHEEIPHEIGFDIVLTVPVFAEHPLLSSVGKG